MVRIFVTGIGTGIGKTIVSAVITEALHADYWKPVQAGLQDGTDSQTVSQLITNSITKIHPEAFRLAMPASPHTAAKTENVQIHIRKMKIPVTANNLVIEGAGGLLVPLNDKELMVDFIKETNAAVILVVKHYLGSINHTLLSVEALKQRQINFAGIIYNGEANASSEEAIDAFTKGKVLGRIGQEAVFSPALVLKYASQIRPSLTQLI
jgi:dethiobiotin synthetase